MVTAKATENDRIKGFEAGADAYLYKPFNEKELRVLLAQLLERREMLRRKYEVAAVKKDKTATRHAFRSVYGVAPSEALSADR